ncbi:hypothetical protein B0H16DRAFT_1735363 [Mycena metata]|uniref:Uncharacterized protein n=1 Tax=Mycena metata TaxID=1033252 RepID=A0AAD7MPK8_9AGAR|nr:hypothetical protein B0H16DRAFT_1735363 [Mycena metata]
MTLALPLAPTKSFKHLRSQPLQTSAGDAPHPYPAFGETIFIYYFNEYFPTRINSEPLKTYAYGVLHASLAFGKPPKSFVNYPPNSPLTQRRAFLGIVDQITLTVPECKPLVHLDAAPDSLDLSLDALPPPTPATRTLPTHPYHHPTLSGSPSLQIPLARLQLAYKSAHPPRPIKARSRRPSPPTSVNLQPPPPSRIGQSVGSGAATPTSSTTTTTNVAATTAATMLALVATAVAALLVAVLLVIALIDHLFFAPPFSALQCNNLHPLARIAALAGFPSRFAREGPGFVYVLGLVDDWNLGDWHAHRIGDSQFLDHFRLKIGVTVDVHKRQLRYRKCDVFQSHFWVWSFRVRNRMVAGESFIVLATPLINIPLINIPPERLCHTLLDIEDNNNRAAFQCPAPRCDTRHQEFWWLRRHGGFLTVHERVRAALALLGEREERVDLQHAWLASY